MSARRLWEELTSGGFARAEAWVRERREESVHLEFKRANPDGSLPSKKDRSEAARTLSAFANVEGGVLVFGIRTTSRDRNPDAAAGLSEIEAAELFASKLREYAADLTTPALPGVRVVALKKAEGPAGIVAVFVPPSHALGPFRTAGDIDKEVRDRYYQRSARGSEPMPHQILGAMFGRVPSPRLHLRLAVQPPPRNTEPPTFSLDIVNAGRGTAAMPSILFEMRADDGSLVALPSTADRWTVVPAATRRAAALVGAGPLRLEPAIRMLVYADGALHVCRWKGALGRFTVLVRVDAEGAVPTEYSGTIDVTSSEEFYFPPLPSEGDTDA